MTDTTVLFVAVTAAAVMAASMTPSVAIKASLEEQIKNLMSRSGKVSGEAGNVADALSDEE